MGYKPDIDEINRRSTGRCKVLNAGQWHDNIFPASSNVLIIDLVPIYYQTYSNLGPRSLIYTVMYSDNLECVNRRPLGASLNRRLRFPGPTNNMPITRSVM